MNGSGGRMRTSPPINAIGTMTVALMPIRTSGSTEGSDCPSCGKEMEHIGFRIDGNDVKKLYYCYECKREIEDATKDA